MITEAIAPTNTEWEAALGAVRDRWADYATNVSTPEMAVSYQTAAYLHHLCTKLCPTRVLDMGSGFSTYVLAGHASVTSVDTDPGWMAKTATYLIAAGRAAALYALNDLPDGGQFDLVFHDIANGDVREETMALSVDRCRPGGVVVFDDMQNQSHRDRMLEVTEGWERYTLPWTLDPIGRFALVAIKPSDPRDRQPALAAAYHIRCGTPSDINQHLPTMVELVKALDAKHVIELGSRSGVSTVAWLYALEQTGGRLTSVDLDDAPDIGTWPHWRHIKGDDLNRALIAGLDQADVVFIDTSHALQHTRDELAAYLPLVRTGGVICGHDSELARPEDSPVSDGVFPVKRAVKEFVERHGFAAINFPENNGFYIVKVV